jgi:hypothetical protein
MVGAYATLNITMLVRPARFCAKKRRLALSNQTLEKSARISYIH